MSVMGADVGSSGAHAGYIHAQPSLCSGGGYCYRVGAQEEQLLGQRARASKLCIHTVEYYMATKMSQLLKHKTWMDLTNIRLKEARNIQNGVHILLSIPVTFENRQK